jgi:integrase
MTALTHSRISANDVLALVRNSVHSEHSKRSYERSALEFLIWWRTSGAPGFVKATVQEYRSALEARGLSSSSVNLQMCVIRRLAAEMADNGLLGREAAEGIGKVKGAKRSGVRLGNWLSPSQAEALISATDAGTMKGKRDRALLSILLGGGFRRGEASMLAFADIQQREGRWVVADLLGKHGRIRTVPIPAWAKAAMDDWQRSAGLVEGHVFRPLSKAGSVAGARLSSQSIFNIVRWYGDQIGVTIGPHDLRRTFAKLAQKGNAALDQIQLSLGHSSIETTQLYLGLRLNLQDAPCDHLGIPISLQESSGPQSGPQSDAVATCSSSGSLQNSTERASSPAC